MKSVTFGRNVIHDIENISDYIRVQTFPDALDKVQTDLSIMIEQMHDNEKLSAGERLLFVENRIIPMATYLVENRDVLSVDICISGERGEDVFEDEYSKSVILIDFVHVMALTFGKYKHSSIAYGKERTVMTFNVSPYPSIELDISSM